MGEDGGGEDGESWCEGCGDHGAEGAEGDLEESLLKSVRSVGLGQDVIEPVMHALVDYKSLLSNTF